MTDDNGSVTPYRHASDMEDFVFHSAFWMTESVFNTIVI